MKPSSDMPDDDALADALRASRVMRDAPEPVIAQAVALFAGRPAASPLPPDVLQRLLAVLSFDSAGTSLLAHGVRGSAGQSRQLLFSAGSHDVDLRITASAAVPGAAAPSDAQQRPWAVIGQLLGPDAAGHAELRSGDEVRRAPLDELSEFRFDDVPGGPCRVSLVLGDRVIELPEIEVPRPGGAAA